MQGSRGAVTVASPPALSCPNPGGASEAGAHSCPRGAVPTSVFGCTSPGGCSAFLAGCLQKPPGGAPSPPAPFRGASSPASAPLSRDHSDFCSGTPPPTTALSVTAFLKVEG